MFRRIKVYNAADGTVTTVTTDRYDSYSPVWSPDGHWLYFLSDRNLKTLVDDPWGSVPAGAVPRQEDEDLPDRPDRRPALAVDSRRTRRRRREDERPTPATT